MASNQINYMSKTGVLVVYKKSYHSQLEFATMDSIYQKLSGHLGQFFHEMYKVVQTHYFLLTTYQMAVQCQKLPTFLELEVS